jgi:Rab-GTPase-TBC domain
MKDIQKDVSRTCNSCPSFPQKSLEWLLEQAMAVSPEGYCQGMNHVGSFIVNYFPDLELGSLFLKAVLKRWMLQIYSSDMKFMLALSYTLEQVVKENIPDLAHHFQLINIDMIMVSPSFLLTAFTFVINDSQVPCIIPLIWDIFIHVKETPSLIFFHIWFKKTVKVERSDYGGRLHAKGKEKRVASNGVRPNALFLH